MSVNHTASPALRSEPLPTALYQAKQVRAIDQTAIHELGIPGFDLMQRAARFTLHALLKAWPDARHLTIVCGSGNNAGDGYVMAALALRKNLHVEILHVSPTEKLAGDARKAFEMAQAHEAPCTPFSQTAWQTRQGANGEAGSEVIVDALLGTGLNCPVEGDYRAAIAAINASSAPVVAVDIPSGLNADTGAVWGLAVEADLTCSFIAMKVGLLTGAGRAYCGDIAFDDLDVPEAAFGQHQPCLERLHLPDLLTQLPPRRADSHKGDVGHVLLIGGDTGFGGAIQLAARAASRMGPGLISVATRASNAQSIVIAQPEVMAHGVNNVHALKPLLERASHIVVGPGLGQSAWSQQMLVEALACAKPCLLDADALNLVASLNLPLPPDTILTPHPGEAARLLNISTTMIQSDRLHYLNTLQQQYGGSVLLKGSGSLIAHPSGTNLLCSDGNAGMASGGMGDVLSGLIGGLWAQGLPTDYCLNLATCLHACAADATAAKAGMRGLLASDLIAPARRLLNQLG